MSSLLSLNEWSSNDYRVLLYFPDMVLKTFERHIQTNASDKEAGGILLGKVHAENIIITEATSPSFMDRCCPNLFERFPFFHRARAKKLWHKSQGVIRYLGEWHTHDEDFPVPSALDRREWSILASRRQDGRPLLAVIVGRKSIYVELVSTIDKGTILQTHK